jgi:hypothetical protein
VADEMITDDRATKEKATDVAATARDEARGVAGDARGEAAAVVSEAGTQARNLADEARIALRQQASDGSSRAAGAVDHLAVRLRALADGNADQAGELQRYARELGDRLGGVAARMQSRGPDGLVDDVQRFARRRPGVFLAVAAGAGFAAGRVFRGAKTDAETSTSSSSGNGDSSGSEVTALGTAGGGAPEAGATVGGSGQSAAGGTRTALPPGVPGPGVNEQQPAGEPSGVRTEPGDIGAERAGPEGGPRPTAMRFGGTTYETPGGER